MQIIYKKYLNVQSSQQVWYDIDKSYIYGMKENQCESSSVFPHVALFPTPNL